MGVLNESLYSHKVPAMLGILVSENHDKRCGQARNVGMQMMMENTEKRTDINKKMWRKSKQNNGSKNRQKIVENES